ncbi:hypothetical protein FQR65_LT20847 [Abscondita terminalis]|nr:hypothetical protein FQR65_LT20847 [Abscondita terminalis]
MLRGGCGGCRPCVTRSGLRGEPRMSGISSWLGVSGDSSFRLRAHKSPYSSAATLSGCLSPPWQKFPAWRLGRFRLCMQAAKQATAPSLHNASPRVLLTPQLHIFVPSFAPATDPPSPGPDLVKRLSTQAVLATVYWLLSRGWLFIHLVKPPPLPSFISPWCSGSHLHPLCLARASLIPNGDVTELAFKHVTITKPP